MFGFPESRQIIRSESHNSAGGDAFKVIVATFRPSFEAAVG